MGRTKGSKNRSSHKAGGDRRSPAFLEQKQQKEEEAREKERRRRDRLLAVQEEKAATAATAAEARERRRQEAHEKTLESLRALNDEDFDCLLAANDNDVEDDDADDSDDEEDYETEDEGEGETKERRKRRRAAYKPTEGSTLHVRLKLIHDLIAGRDGARKISALRTQVMNGMHWIGPDFDPLTNGSATKPSSWCLEQCWVFVFLPFLQYRMLVGELKDCECIYDGCDGKYCSNQYDWRPAFHHERLVWIYHRRDQCNKCGRTVSEIDPRFLSRLPTRVVERFPFIMTPSGPGVHESMVYTFAHLLTKGIMFGQYVNLINELHAIRYDMVSLGYLEALADKRRQTGDHFDTHPPALFPGFSSPGEFSGLRLTKALLKSIFGSFMCVTEPYQQAYFQTCADEGTTIDESFKFSNAIRAQSRPGKVFTATHGIMAKSGKCNTNRLTYTKSNMEIEPVIRGYKQSRDNAGCPKLKRFESDNITGNRRLMEKHFPELLDGVVPSTRGPGNLIKATINESEFVYIRTIEAANDWALAMAGSNVLDDAIIYVGLDAEWNRGDAGVRLLMVALPGKLVAVFDIQEMLQGEERRFPEKVKNVLQLKNLVVMGSQIGGDCSRLEKYGVHIDRRLDLKYAALRHDPDQPHGTSLAGLVRTYLGLSLDKFGQQEDWAQRPLPRELLQYAALDAVLSLRVGMHLTSVLASQPHGLKETPTNLQIGSKVELFISGRVVASGKVEFLGGGGHQLKWGTLTVGTGKALFRIERVVVPGIKPPFSFTARGTEDEPGTFSWSKHDTTIGQLFGDLRPVIAVHTSSLHVNVGVQTFLPMPMDSVARTDNPTSEEAARDGAARDIDVAALSGRALETEMASDACKEAAQDFVAPVVTQPALSVAGGMALDVAKQTETVGTEARDTAQAVTRLAVQGTEAVGTEVTDTAQAVTRLAVQGTETVSNVADGAARDSVAGGEAQLGQSVSDVQNLENQTVAAIMEGVGGEGGSFYDLGLDEPPPPLSRSKSDIWHQFHLLPLSQSCPVKSSVFELLIHSTFVKVEEDFERVTKFLLSRGVQMDELDDHFYHNKEWWRWRVRMLTYKAEEHAHNIRFVHHLFKHSETMKQFYTPEVKSYFEKFEQKCLNGDFDELSDVSLFRHVGVDSHGLDLWIRQRGSVHLENMHQKMRVSVGPWGIGARTAHWLLVCLMHRYNVNTGIRRCGEHDFGHPWHVLIDRKQILMQEIYNVVVFPRHRNVLQFKPIEDFVSVGIGPLCYSTDYVQTGEPDPRLVGELKFIARQMKLKIPPMPIEGPAEIALYNTFRESHPSMSAQDTRELAKLYLRKSNGTTIFPKLPSMIEHYDRRWKRNNEIKLAKKAMKQEFLELRTMLSSRRTQAPVETSNEPVVDSQGNSSSREPVQQHIHVPPINAQYQQSVVDTADGAPQSGQACKRCFYYPHCKKEAWECGGIRRDRCEEVNQKRVTIPDMETFLAEKEDRKRLEKRTSEAERKKRKRTERSSG